MDPPSSAGIARAVGAHARDELGGGRKGWFHTTRWSLVMAAGGAESPERRKALEELCRIYWEPLRVYVVQRGFSPADAEDLTQEMFVRLLSDGTLASIQPEKGRFRSLLLAAARHQVSNHVRRNRALRRGGGAAPIALEDAPDPHDDRVKGADRCFDRAWARQVVEEAGRKLEAEYAESGRGRIHDALSFALRDEMEEGRLAEVARSLGMTSAGVKVALHRLRRRFGQGIVREVEQTVGEPAEVEAEVRYVLALLEDSPGEPEKNPARR